MKNFLRALLIGALAMVGPFARPAAAAEPSASPAASPPGSMTSSLPSAERVVEHFVKEMGGKKAFQKVQSQHVKGQYLMPAQGISGQLEVFASQPNKLLVVVNLGQIGKISSGYDGRVAWTMNPATGPMLLEGKQRSQIEDEADFLGVLHDAKDYRSMRTVGMAQFDGKSCYKLAMVKKSGVESTEYYDVKTGLLVGAVTPQETQLGSMIVTNIMNEYRQFGPLRMPSKMTQKVGPIQQVTTIDSVDYNHVDDSVFTPPPEIKALLKKP